MNKIGVIFIVDDDEDVLATARIVLRPYFEKIKTFEDPNDFLNALKNEHADVALVDMNFSIGDTSAKDGLNLISKLKEDYPHLSIVSSTAYGDIELAVETIKLGATDFVVKPWDNDKLIATIRSARELAMSKRQVHTLQNRQKALVQVFESSSEHMIGTSPQIKSVLRTIEKVANTDANVLILGENGTGKSLAAKIIHQHSDRNEQPMIHVDLGAISESLFESEMFGHKKGAFTDAKQDRIGRFELSDSGTLFLDEIGNLPISLQAKILTSIENKYVIPIGSNEMIPFDSRIISATNKSIYAAVKKGTFREDLLYRLNTIEITIPPLRERKEDIPIIAQHALELNGKKYSDKPFQIAESGLKKLASYDWPGNIRELHHIIERAMIMSDSNMLKSEDFPLTRRSEPPVEKPKKLEDIERESIKQAMLEYHGNLSKVAKELGMGRTTLYRKIDKYGL